ncbi:uncharacterized protein L969DRAFT_84810 [Mixia osmundae IAM 14324]|uniref:Enoyl-CoA hydratase n=1 Tax=Mixia osmundae (strain CBS 9802 / IAM 14324 / JCM 22182 / KY 12970) TaxID=764103 RepID=G7DT90_MIXOS|nr:uncharacterized protein L969DRAFT_84810 [Mixia osmundae IAM 14324]KEI42925.1 hypothetical protein L969DRAFT_84810 [Mixia osmundae IAM 14324]GAA93737.1 hypothetical protein E5Q_00383 [Mixia osmundae IAM 14324]
MVVSLLASPTHYPPGAEGKQRLCALTHQIIEDTIVFTIELTHAPDNRLVPELLGAYSTALDDAERIWRADVDEELEGGPGKGQAALITIGLRDKDRFFSNGLDLDRVMTTEGFFTDHYYPIVKRILTFPMPTIAALNGHTFAGGLLIAMCHDYRVAKNLEGKGRIMLAMNEVDFGAPIPQGMITTLRAKMTPNTFRDVCVLGTRFFAPDALRAGLVDHLAESADDCYRKSVELATRMGVKSAKSAVGMIKVGMYHHVLADIAADPGNNDLGPGGDIAPAWERLGEVPKWQEQKAKL